MYRCAIEKQYYVALSVNKSDLYETASCEKKQEIYKKIYKVKYRQ
jgi:hypothetical protein